MTGDRTWGCRQSGRGVHRQKPFLLSPYARTPFLPQAGAGRFVQILVYTPVPPQRSFGELPLFRFLSYCPPSCQLPTCSLLLNKQ